MHHLVSSKVGKHERQATNFSLHLMRLNFTRSNTLNVNTDYWSAFPYHHSSW